MGNPFDELDNQGQYAGRARVKSSSTGNIQYANQTTKSTAGIGQLSIDLSGTRSAEIAKSETGINPLGVIGTILGTPIDLAMKGLGGLGDVFTEIGSFVPSTVGTPRRRMERYLKEGDAGLKNRQVEDLLKQATGEQNVIQGAFGGLLNDDPKYLSDAAKAMLRQGADYEEVWQYMKKNSQMFSANLGEDLAASIIFDPMNLNPIGEGVKFLGKTAKVASVSAALSRGEKAGQSFEEVMAATKVAGKPAMSKAEIAIAKRLKFIAPAYDMSMRAGASGLEKFRGPAVAAVSNVIGIKNIADTHDELKALSPSVAKQFIENVNTTLLYVMRAASKAPLAQNAAENARAWATAVFDIAKAEGIEGLAKHPGFRGLPQEFYQKYVQLADRFKTGGQTEEAVRELQIAIDELVPAKNLQLLNEELRGPFLNDSTKLSRLAKLRRGSVIGAARNDVINSVLRHETQVARALEAGTPLSQSEYGLRWIQRFANAVGDTEASQVANTIARKLDTFTNSYNAAAGNVAKRSDIIREVSNYLEILRMGSFGKVTRKVAELKALGGVARNITAVTENSFSRESLSEAIKVLGQLLEDEDIPNLKRYLTDLVGNRDALSYGRDSLIYAQQLEDSPLEEGRLVLKTLKDMMGQGAYTSRLPEGLVAKLDLLEAGPVAPSTAVAEEVSTAATQTVQNIADTEAAVNTYLNDYTFREFYPGFGETYSGGVKQLDRPMTIETAIANGGDNAFGNPEGLSLHLGSSENNAADWFNSLTKQRSNAEQNALDFFSLRRIEERSAIGPLAIHEAFSVPDYSTLNDFQRAVMDHGLVGESARHIETFGGYIPKLWEDAERPATGFLDRMVMVDDAGTGALTDPLWTSDWQTRYKNRSAFIQYGSADAEYAVFDALDGVHMTKVTPFNTISEPYLVRVTTGMPMAASHEYVTNRIRRVLHIADDNTLWHEPEIKATRIAPNNAVTLDEYDPFLGQFKAGATALVQPIHHSLALGEVTAEAGGRAFIARNLEDITKMDLESRIKLFFDPAKIATSMVFDATPVGRGMDLDKVLITTEQALTDAGEVTKAKRFAQLLAFDNPIDLKTVDAIWEPSKAAQTDASQYIREYLREYMQQLVRIGGDQYTLTEVMPELLGNAPEQNVDVMLDELTAKWETYFGDPIEQAFFEHIHKINSMRQSIQEVDHLQLGFLQGKKWFQLNDNNRAFSWADIFHQMDSTYGPIQNLKTNMAPQAGGTLLQFKNLKEYVQAAPAGVLGKQPARLFDVLANHNDAISERIKQLQTGGFLQTEQEILDWLYEMDTVDPSIAKAFAGPVQYRASLVRPTLVHNFLESVGNIADARLQSLIVADAPDLAAEVANIDISKMGRAYGPLGKPSESIRYVVPKFDTIPVNMASALFNEQAIFNMSKAYDNASQFMPAGRFFEGVTESYGKEISQISKFVGYEKTIAGLAAAKAAQATADQVAERQKLFEQYSNDKVLPKLLDLRRTARQVGYELGIEPEKGYLEGLQIVRDVRGVPVIRPKYDLYTSLGEDLVPSDYGLKQLDQVVKPTLKTKLQQFASTPIHNNELYDTAVDRLRVFLGARITREQAARAMAEITQKAINQDINPGGLTDHDVDRAFLNVFGGGEKASRTYNQVFKGESSRAALLYALAGDAGRVGYTTAVSKRIQERFPTLATISQKLFPLLRYRYNPQFNQQEAIEPFALTVLRGIRGSQAYEEASMLTELLSAPGSFRYDNHEVGAHIFRQQASIADSLSQMVPEINNIVERRGAKIILDKAADSAGWVLASGTKQKEAIAASKVDAMDVTAANEFKRATMEEFAANFPVIRKIAWDLTKSVDPADWFNYLIDSHVNGTIPELTLRLGETAARSYTWGATVKIDYADVVKELLKRDNLTPTDLDAIEEIALIAEKTGASSAAQDELIRAFRDYKARVKFMPKQTIQKVAAMKGDFQGETAFTTFNNLTAEARSALGAWVHGSYSTISRYLAAKAEFGVQKTSLLRNEEEMIKAVKGSRIGNKDLYDASAVGDARFAGIDNVITELDGVIKSNRIAIRASIARKFAISDLIPAGETLKVGDTFGMENISAWTRKMGFAESWGGGDTIMVVDNAKGLPGIDLGGSGIGMGQENEVLLPRGIQVRVVSIINDGSKNIYKVDVLLQPDLQLAMDRLAPDDAARIALEKALNTLDVEQEQVRRSESALRTLFASEPAILDDAKRAAVLYGDEPSTAGTRTIRQKRSKTAPPVSKVVDGQDPFSITFTRNAPKASPMSSMSVIDEKVVFGKKTGVPSSGINKGADTGIWVGTDGIKRYAKVAGTNSTVSAMAAFNEYLAAEMYRKMGVMVPEVSLSIRNGDLYVVSAWQEGIKEFGNIGLNKVPAETAQQFLDNHIADVILNNWDAVGPDGMNAGILPNGDVVRIDVGGAGRYRAGGQFKSAANAELVDLGFWYSPQGTQKGRPAWGYRQILDRGYPELEAEASTLEIPTMIQQFDDIMKSLGTASDSVAESVSKIADDLISNKIISPEEIKKESEAFASLIQKRIDQLSVNIEKLRKERLLMAQAEEAAKTGAAISTPLPKLKIAKREPWLDLIIGRLAGQMNNGYRLPGLEEALQTLERGETLSRAQSKALGRGLAQYLYERKAVTDFVDFSRAAHARSAEVAAKEQLYNPSKSALERTLNHPFTGFYPTSYMYGKILPVFGNALFKYAPFTGEYAPFVGFRRLNIFADHIAAALEQNPELQKVVMTRTPLINYLNSLLPGVPTDVGAGLPYWVRNGILRPVAEGKLEDIPGRVTESVLTTGERLIGPLNYARTMQSSVTQIQSYLTGDPSKSVLDEISDFLIPGAGN
jgi:hypothetical protein